MTGSASMNSSAKEPVLTKMLIVDNSPWQRAAICEVAKSVGFTDDDFVMATDREEAAFLLDRKEFGFAVVNVSLHGGRDEEGINVINWLHAEQPQCQMVALTSDKDSDAGVRAMRAGADSFINQRHMGDRWREELKWNLTLLLETASENE